MFKCSFYVNALSFRFETKEDLDIEVTIDNYPFSKVAAVVSSVCVFCVCCFASLRHCTGTQICIYVPLNTETKFDI